MRVLVTGSEGLIGRRLVPRLEEEGMRVVRYDLRHGQDVLDVRTLRHATNGCDAVVHLAARVDADDAPADVLRTNLQGTANVLAAAEASGVRRIVYASSVNALGVFRGEGRPAYLPIDDDHPCRPRSAYGVSKVRSEHLCARSTARTGVPTVCLRPPGVWEEATYTRIAAARAANPESEWAPYWEYGAFLDVRDCAAAFLRALVCEDPGHLRLLLCAPDVSTSGATALELASRLLPDVEVRDRTSFDADPHRALIDTRRARRVLQWAPVHTWRAGVRALRLP